MGLNMKPKPDKIGYTLEYQARDGRIRFAASFTEGDPHRDGQPVCDDNMITEAQSYEDHWQSEGQTRKARLRRSDGITLLDHTEDSKTQWRRQYLEELTRAAYERQRLSNFERAHTDALVHNFAVEYHNRTEAMDRSSCTGGRLYPETGKMDAVPANSEERARSNRYAHRVRKDIRERMRAEGLDPRRLHDAIRTAEHLLGPWDEQSLRENQQNQRR